MTATDPERTSGQEVADGRKLTLDARMKRFDFAQIVTILANVGVVIGLVFLTLEIRQNNAQMRAQGAYSINQSVETLNQAIYLDEEFADLLHRGEKSFSDLDSVEQSRLATFFFSEINLAQYILSLEDEGLTDLHFRYVDFKINQFRTIPGRRQFVEAYVRPSTYFGRSDIQKMLTAD